MLRAWCKSARRTPARGRPAQPQATALYAPLLYRKKVKAARTCCCSPFSRTRAGATGSRAFCPVSINELASGEHNGGSQAIAAEVAKRATLRLITSRGLNNELNLLCSCAGE